MHVHVLSIHANSLDSVQFITCLGMKDTWQFRDVYGLDPELLSMVPRPVCALLLLFPVTEKVTCLCWLCLFMCAILMTHFKSLSIINTRIVPKALCHKSNLHAFTFLV